MFVHGATTGLNHNTRRWQMIINLLYHQLSSYSQINVCILAAFLLH